VASLSLEDSDLRFGLDKSLNRKKVYSTAVTSSLISMAIGMIFLAVIASMAGFKQYTGLMMVFMFTSEFRWIQQQHLKAKDYIKLYTVDSLLSVVSLVLFTLLFMVVFKLDITGYILSIIMSDLLSILFLMYFGNIRKDFSFSEFDPAIKSKMFRYSLPLIPTAVLWWIVSSSDLFLVSKFLGDTVNGLYSCAYRIPALISFVSVIFFRAWQMSAITQYGTDEYRQYYSKVMSAYSAIMFVGSTGIMLLIQPLTMLLTGEKFWESYKMAPFLIIASLMQSFCNFLSGIYNAAGRNEKSFYTSLVAALTNIVLNIVLIPMVGVQGAAFATMTAYVVCFFIRLKDTRSLVGYKVEWDKLIINSVIILFMAVIILADAAFMKVWLFIGFLAACAVNAPLLIQTAKKLMHRDGDTADA
jgi:O-antigen/teichoic acid export membrane protein